MFSSCHSLSVSKGTGDGRHADRRTLYSSGPAALGPAAHSGVEVGQSQVTLVRRPRELFRGHAADPLATIDIYFVALPTTIDIQNFHLSHGSSLHDGRRKTLSQP